MLISACERLDFKEIYTLLSRKHLDYKDSEGNTALLISSKAGNTEAVETLLKSGAKVNDTNSIRQTSLYLACKNGYEDTARVLLEYKANPNLSDKRGWTPLMLSVYQDNQNLVKLLLEFQCDAEQKDCFGKQAIDRAKNLSMVELIRAAVNTRRKLAQKQVGSLVSPDKRKNLLRRASLPSFAGMIPEKTPISPLMKPQKSSRSPTRSYVTPDLRKKLREKIDLSIKSQVESLKTKSFPKWTKDLHDFLKDSLSYKSEAIRQNLLKSLDTKAQDVLHGLNWSLKNSAQTIKERAMKPARATSPEKLEDVIGKAEKTSRDRVQMKKKIKRAVSHTVAECLGEAKEFLHEEIQRMVAETEGRAWANYSKNESAQKRISSEADFTLSSNSEREEDTQANNGPKAKPKSSSLMSQTVSLQEFLKLESASKNL